MTKAMEIELTAARARELATSIRDTITDTQVTNAIASIKKAAGEGKFIIACEDLTVAAEVMLKALGYSIYRGKGGVEVLW